MGNIFDVQRLGKVNNKSRNFAKALPPNSKKTSFSLLFLLILYKKNHILPYL